LLKQRIITAVVLAAVAMWAIFGWPDGWYAVFLLVATAACGWEWAALGNLHTPLKKGLFAAAVTAVTALLMLFDDGALLRVLVLLSVLSWVAIALDLYVRPVIEKTPGVRLSLLSLAALLLITAVLVLYWLRGQLSPGVIVYVVALVAAADIGAYFCGKRFGRRKLAVQISAGKTIEGAMGGLLLAAIVALLAVVLLDFSAVSVIAVFFFSLVAAVFSIAGDLFISRAKRTHGVKDSGRLLPGHGGVLDRFDGLLAAVPWLAFAVLWT
jgi:phosphatidate cytidylyltransferase